MFSGFLINIIMEQKDSDFIYR